MGPAGYRAVLCSEPCHTEPGCTEPCCITDRAPERIGLQTGPGSIAGRPVPLPAVPRAVPYAVPCPAPCPPMSRVPRSARLYGRAVPRSTCRAGPAPPPLRKPQAQAQGRALPPQPWPTPALGCSLQRGKAPAAGTAPIPTGVCDSSCQLLAAGIWGVCTP